MTALPFLSPEWFAKVAELVEEHGAAPPGQTDVVMNVVVTDDPGGGERRWHMGAQDGRAIWGEGLLERADVTLTTDYATAKDVFVAGDAMWG